MHLIFLYAIIFESNKSGLLNLLFEIPYRSKELGLILRANLKEKSLNFPISYQKQCPEPQIP